MSSSADARAAPAPAPEGEGLDDDEILLGSPVATPPEAPVVQEQARRHRLRAPPVRSGILSAYIIGDARLPDPVGAADPRRLPGSADQQVIGIVDLEWKLVASSQEARVAHQGLLPIPRGRPSRAQAPWAYVEYRTVEAWPLGARVDVPSGVDLTGAVASQRLRVVCSDAAVTHTNDSVREFLAKRGARPVSEVLELPYSVAVLGCDAPSGELLRSVPLLLRGLPDGLVAGHPRSALVTMWRRDFDVRRLAQVPRMEPDSGDRWADIALELPSTKKTGGGGWR